MQPIIEVRLAMVDHGFTPIPVIGKVPPLKKWQETTGVCKATLEDWDRNWPNASNTGILTRLTPTHRSRPAQRTGSGCGREAYPRAI